MAENKNTLPLTYGKFALQGIVGGCSSDKFCQTIDTKTGKKMKKLRFFVQTSNDNKVYVDLIGMEQDTVRFQKFDNATKKYITKDVPWQNRKTFKEDGFNLSGICLGLEKVTDKTGKTKNLVKYLVPLDAIDYIATNLHDDMTVYCRGDINYQTSEDKLYTSLNLKQVSLVSAKNELTKEDLALVGTPEGTKEISDFNQTIILQEVVKDEEKEDVFHICGTVLNSKGAVSVSYVTHDKKLASSLRKQPAYTSILVSGHITQEAQVVEEDDGWGEGNVLDRKQTFTPVYLVTGADPKTIDSETYNEENIAKFIASKREFGSSTSDPTERTVAELGADSLPFGDDDDEWD